MEKMLSVSQGAKEFLKNEKLEQQLLGLELSDEIKKLLIEGKVKMFTFETGGKTVKEYEKELADKNIHLSFRGNQVLEKIVPSKNRKSSNFIGLTVKDLGFENGTTNEQVYEHAQELGLELCEPEDGPEFRLVSNDPELMFVGMDPVAVSDGTPGVFYLNGGNDNLTLDGSRAVFTDKSYSGSRWLFRLKKKKSE